MYHFLFSSPQKRLTVTIFWKPNKIQKSNKNTESCCCDVHLGRYLFLISKLVVYGRLLWRFDLHLLCGGPIRGVTVGQVAHSWFSKLCLLVSVDGEEESSQTEPPSVQFTASEWRGWASCRRLTCKWWTLRWGWESPGWWELHQSHSWYGGFLLKHTLDINIIF